MRYVSPRSGFFSIRLIILVLPLALLWMGGQGLYIALKNRKPVSMTFAEYARTRPDGHWVQLKNTKLDIMGAVYSGRLGSIKEVYIPLHSNDDSAEDEKVIALLHTKDPATLDLMREMKQLKDNSVAQLEFVLKNKERLFPVKEVNGLLEFGIDSDDGKRMKIAKLSDDLVKDFVVIEHNRQPSLLMSLAFLAGSFFTMWLFWLRKSSRSTPPPLPTPTTQPPLGPPPPLPGDGLPPGTIVK
jgi:hypothetical protein